MTESIARYTDTTTCTWYQVVASLEYRGHPHIRAPRDEPKQALLPYIALICSDQYMAFSIAGHADLTASK